MIVKIKTRKKPTFKQLLNYMLHHKERLFDEGNQRFLLKHNLRGDTIEEWVEQYKENEIHRKLRRPDSVILSHEILSWHRDDTENISIEKMEEMALEYIKLRNPNAMYIAVPHTDKEHFHIHICASGVEYHTGKSLRMSKTEFTKLKQDIQGFQRQKFPELSKSIVEHGRTEKKDLALPTDREYQIKRRTGRATDKEQVLGILNDCYHRAVSKKDFFERVKESGLKIYFRGGRISGVIYGKRKYRFKRLGFTEERTQELEVGVKRGREIQNLRKEKQVIQREIGK